MTDSTLVIHCKSKDNDLGKHVINAGGNYNWSFKENLLQTTLFWCNFSSKHGQATGDVFWPEQQSWLIDHQATGDVFWPEQQSWLTDQCVDHNCIWTAGDQGISLHYNPTNTNNLMYHWK
ncbi:S-protein homolog 74-like [Cucurbita pepo subsp. pepo]|uniref:S-protein homolog 74-like n=1 Tax=Cucurbita pepo subsp. pepo TaxID=3664 RepID=UPI000C9D4199|nr:S-protein homolog 74-like [Cucurbita pepo subsp. pepo]